MLVYSSREMVITVGVGVCIMDAAFSFKDNKNL